MDKFSKDKRSKIMSQIRSSNTKFEQHFIEQLNKHIDRRFELNVKKIEGKPDVVFEKQRLCIFLDSDFWHGWYYPRWKHLLKNDFWRTKIENTRKRDKKNTVYLRRHGWTVFRFWAHNLKRNSNYEIEHIVRFLKRSG